VDAELGWVTLTANQTSVRAILREVLEDRVAGRVGGVGKGERRERGGGEGATERFASIWIVDPRSLAEGMSSLPSARASPSWSG